MARETKKPRKVPVAPAREFNLYGGWRWLAWAGAALLLFYFTPLFSSSASIQWDAVDVHLPSQAYFAAHVKAGHLPFWTHYLFGGFPFLADPQVGAFYPLNWPFFLFGVTPAAIQAELALHSLIALAGAFLLLRRLSGSASAALVGALAYALGGFFAAHSSHLGMFQGAALLPWLLYAFERAQDGAALRWSAAAAAIAGAIFLAGHLQTAVYSLLGLALYAACRIAEKPARWRRALPASAGIAAMGAALAAVMILPGMELSAQSIRQGMNFGGSSEGTLTAGALATLLYPNAIGSLGGRYTGAGDITQTFLYSGLLLLPLAGYALRRRMAWPPAVALVLLPVWYMLGPGAGLYRLGALVPYLHQVRAPAHLWFVASMGLAILAALGVAELETTRRKPWIGLLLVGVFAFDLCYFNSWTNPLAYARASYQELYGAGEDALRDQVGPKLERPFRLHVPDRLTMFGSLNSALTAGVETTGGYNPLELASWHDYKAAAEKNRRLLDGLAVALEVRPERKSISLNPDALPRAWFAPQLVGVSTDAESRASLEELDPRRQSVVLGLPAGVRQDPQARVTSIQPRNGQVAVTYTAETPSLLRLAEAWFPGWQAKVDGRPLEVLRVNHALIGAVVPPGSHEVIFEYNPNRFRPGMWISLVALSALLGLAVFSPRARAASAAPSD